MKKIARVFVTLVIVLGLIYLIVMNLPQANIKSQSAVDSVTAIELYNAFDKNENAAVGKYQDKVINVSGKIGDKYQDESGATVIIFEGNMGEEIVMVTMEPSETKHLKELKSGDEVEVKALCTGLLMEVILSKGLIQ